MAFFLYITILLSVLQIQDTVFGGYCYRQHSRRTSTRKPCGFLNWGRCASSRTVYYSSRYCCPGWTGHYCSEGICSRKCENNGICTSPNHCDCRYGYTGQFCEKPICRVPCRNGGTCVAPNDCKCLSGFKGESCQTPICSPACQNGGTCLRPGVCKCPNWCTGSYCQSFVCSPRCVKGSCSGPNKCSCERGWSGNRCETPVCLQSCRNGGTCTRPYHCECSIGYTGISCQNAISVCDLGRYGWNCTGKCSDNCRNSVCNNENGTCTYGCIPGYKGDKCDHAFSEAKTGILFKLMGSKIVGAIVVVLLLIAFSILLTMFS